MTNPTYTELRSHNTELERKKDVLYSVQKDCQHCGRFMLRGESELIEEANRGGHITLAYLVHSECASAAMCDLLKRSMRMARGQPDLRIAR